MTPLTYPSGGVDFLLHLRVAGAGCAPGERLPRFARRAAALPAGASWDAAAASLRGVWLPFWYLRLCLSALLFCAALRRLLPAAAACAAAPALAWLLLPRRVVAERVLALRGGGLRCSALREDGTVVLRAPPPAAALASVALREAVRRCGVEWFLCAVVEGGGEGGTRFLPLAHARPRLPELVRLLRALRTVFPVE